MEHLLRIPFGVLTYLYTLYVMTLAFAWISNLGAIWPNTLLADLFPHNLDGDLAAAPWSSISFRALLGNALLLASFALPHSTLARPQVKGLMRKVIPLRFERTVFVLQASLLLHNVAHGWQPVPVMLWEVTGPSATLLHVIAAWGFVQVILSTFLIDHFDLFGLRQTLMGGSYHPPGLAVHSLYKYVRHPLYLGFLLNFFSTPVMTVGRLWFACVCTAYILMAIQLEEHDISKELGAAYRKYRSSVPMLLPSLKPYSGSHSPSTIKLE